MTPPVLFLIFNRPDLTKQVFQRIRAAQPPKLFIGADGPREGRSEEPRLCEEARHIATQVDWHCEVHTLFRDENLGCKEAVSSAITWFFEQVEAGIILEDDCVPHPSFFSYCDALLDYYAQDERIFAIGGNNFQPPTRNYGASYYFSVYPHIWGWATWRRAWRHYDGRIEAWPKLKQESWLQGWMGDRFAARYWSNIFDRVHNGEIDSWDYPWTFSICVQVECPLCPELTLFQTLDLIAEEPTPKIRTHLRQAWKYRIYLIH